MQTPNGKNAPSTTTESHIAMERAGISDSQRQAGDRPMTETEMKKPLPTSQVSKANKVSTEAYKSPIDDSNKSSAEKPDSARGNIEKDNITKDNTTGRTRNEPGNPNTDSPVANFVNHLIDTAYEKRASDIHIEPFENEFRVRLRIDGLLQPGPIPPKDIAGRLSSRIKVLGQLDISERRLPQDGRLRLNTASHNALDLRISSLPTLWGEKIVLRLLNVDAAHRGIEHLGLEARQKTILLSAIGQPQGLILVTGPTGSGKTMTLYSALDLLNQTQCNISTVEDPVEVNVHGINQVNVNARIGLDFATTLRALLRQDPDVIMVGEIRDLETASIAIRAAQTGHLVLSTLHTNSAFATLERLIQMGIPRHNLTTSISLIVAQRLLRKLCIHCKTLDRLPKAILLEAGVDPSALNNPIFKAHPEGCLYCHQGYQGRLGIFEIIKMDQKTLELLDRSTGESPAIASELRKHSLRKGALEKVIQGVTSLQEANRLTLIEEAGQ
jgi:type IV pilus assembly protein PilB